MGDTRERLEELLGEMRNAEVAESVDDYLESLRRYVVEASE